MREEVGSRGGAEAAAAALSRAGEERRAGMEAFAKSALDQYDQVPMHPMAAGHALVEGLPEGGVIVD